MKLGLGLTVDAAVIWNLKMSHGRDYNRVVITKCWDSRGKPRQCVMFFKKKRAARGSFELPTVQLGRKASGSYPTLSCPIRTEVLGLARQQKGESQHQEIRTPCYCMELEFSYA